MIIFVELRIKLIELFFEENHLKSELYSVIEKVKVFAAKFVFNLKIA